MEDEEADYENEKEKMDEQQVETRIDGRRQSSTGARRKTTKPRKTRRQGRRAQRGS